MMAPVAPHPASWQLAHLPLAFPPSPRILYRAFRPTGTHTHPQLALEQGRRKIIQHWRPGVGTVDVPLAVVDHVKQILWTFAIYSDDGETIPSVTLHGLALDGLTEEAFDSYRPVDVYPCSEACSSMPRPCASCPPSWNIRDYLSSACLLPRLSLRSAHAHFLLAVRDHIIDSLCISSLKSSNTLQKIPGGFIFRGSRTLGEWGTGWNGQSDSQPLKASMVHLHLTATGILAQLVMRRSSFQETRPKMEPGLPIVLLPFLTPAYYVKDIAADADMDSTFRNELCGHGYSSSSNNGFFQCWIPFEDDKDINTPSSSRSEQNAEAQGILLTWPKSMCLVSSTRAPARRIPSPSTIMLSPKGKEVESSKPRTSCQRSSSVPVRDLESIASHANEFVDAVVKDRERVRDLQRSNDPKSVNSPVIESSSPKTNFITHNPRNATQTYPSPPGLSPGSSYHQSAWHAHSPLQFSSFSPFTALGQDSPNALTAALSSANFNPFFFQFQNPQSSFPTPSSFNSTTTVQNQSSFPVTEPFIDTDPPVIDDVAWSGITFPSGDDPPGERSDRLPNDTVDLNDILGDKGMIYFNSPSNLPIVASGEASPLGKESDTEVFQWKEDILLTPKAPQPVQPVQVVDIPVAVAADSHGLPLTNRFLESGYTTWPPDASSITPVPNFPGNEEAFTALDLPDSLSMSHMTRGIVLRHHQHCLPISVRLSQIPGAGSVSMERTIRDVYDALSNPKTELVSMIQRIIGQRRVPSSGVSRQTQDDNDHIWRMSTDGSDAVSDTVSDVASEDSINGVAVEQTDPEGPVPHTVDIESPVAIALRVRLDRAAFQTFSRPFRTWPTVFNAPAIAVDDEPPEATERTLKPINSAPTPVSPGVIPVASVQRDRRRAATELIIHECVENEYWFRCFKEQDSPPLNEGNLQEWPQEFVSVIRCLQTDLGFGIPLDLASLGSVSVKDTPMRARTTSLDDPLLTLGRGDSVVQVLPSALKFWEKIGLSPLSGRKDVVCYALFEQDDSNMESFVTSWLERVSQVYFVRNLGNHTIGTSSWHPRGLVPLRWANYQRTLSIFLRDLDEAARVVLYLIAPPSFLLADFIGYAGLLGLVRKFDLLGERILLHVVPLASVVDHSQLAKHGGLIDIVTSVYERLNRCLDRLICQKGFRRMPHQRAWVRAPSFTISRASAPTFKFALEWPPHATDVTDRYLLFHVGYKLSRDKDWLFAACVDQRGHGHETRHWYMGDVSMDESFESLVAQTILNFSIECSRRVQVEWRSVIAKMGYMGLAEIEAWELCLATKATQDAAANGPLNFEILSVDDGSVTFLSTKHLGQFAPVKSGEDSTTLFADGSSSTFAIFPALRLHFISPTLPNFGTDSFEHGQSSKAALIAEVESTNLLPICSSYLVHVPGNSPLVAAPIGSASARTCASVVQLSTLLVWKSANSTLGMWKRNISDLQRDWACNFHELAVLAKLRWGFKDWGALPYHLVAVEVMCAVTDMQKDVHFAEHDRST
ncbi:uncharacterized protein EI90DRAFT_3153135 [Cantharellus anzutake]|uniref:uncharacterized protein n=1 Tax=Cantharellus anzutake TaxID=1750568 RepID=UPI0019039A01|nr:uncharacterized protein EI90DRAFT_3153135 [Cantharellus anzutake]KAF8334975.1 hypothetical protein EI90DRAFT_3153135 [Cantharellus anzutake]